MLRHFFVHFCGLPMAFMLHHSIEYPVSGVVEQSDQYSKILGEESTSHP